VAEPWAHEVFAANLRRLRERQHLSQEALAERSGLHRTEISLLERAEREPRLSTIALLADALGVKVQKLLAGVDGAPIPPRQQKPGAGPPRRP
jgi:transcriptional regulator with XRE-family HTH domain